MITPVQQNFISKKTTVDSMIVIGLLSTEEEAQEIQFIAKICTVENRIRYLVHVDRIKQLVSKEEKL